MTNLRIDTLAKKPPTRDASSRGKLPEKLPAAKATKEHPTKASSQPNASLFFVGTATTILEWEGLRLITDTNFLHEGDHVHLGPGVTGTGQTNPAVDLYELPPIDMVLLSHYHADHFDQLVEESLRRDLPIISTPHAKSHLANKGDESFTAVTALDFWELATLDLSSSSADQTSKSLKPHVRVTGMPGKHIGDGVLGVAIDILKAVPPTNGWILELGYSSKPGSDDDFECGYRIYISGDTLFVNEHKKIPDMYTHACKPIDLMLIHLGGTTIPSPSMPLIMVTMHAKQGIQLVNLVQPGLTIPIHYDDYDMFLTPLSEFQEEVKKANLDQKTVYRERGDVKIIAPIPGGSPQKDWNPSHLWLDFGLCNI